MWSRRESVPKTIALLAGLAAQVQGKRSLPPLTVPFEFASGRGSLLIQARVNHQPVLLMIDTGSSHTILRPSVAGLSPSESLAKPRIGAGVAGDALGREVTLEVGQRVWPARSVSVMDLSEALSPYKEKIGGLLGLDFLLEFSQVVINLKQTQISFVQ
jgi:predicted aspartyl protease